jgi:hypothetical protein
MRGKGLKIHVEKVERRSILKGREKNHSFDPADGGDPGRSGAGAGVDGGGGELGGEFDGQ